MFQSLISALSLSWDIFNIWKKHSPKKEREQMKRSYGVDPYVCVEVPIKQREGSCHLCNV